MELIYLMVIVTSEGGGGEKRKKNKRCPTVFHLITKSPYSFREVGLGIVSQVSEKRVGPGVNEVEESNGVSPRNH